MQIRVGLSIKLEVAKKSEKSIPRECSSLSQLIGKKFFSLDLHRKQVKVDNFFFGRNLQISSSTVDDKVEARHQIQDGEVAASEKEQFEGTKIKSQLLIPRITKCNYIYLLLSKQGQKLK